MLPMTVIARSKATKQSIIFWIASPKKVRNDVLQWGNFLNA